MFISVVLNGFLFFSNYFFLNKLFFVKIYKKIIFLSVSRKKVKSKLIIFFVKKKLNYFHFYLIPFVFSLLLYCYMYIL